MYRCSECSSTIGAMIGKDGKPELFKCIRTGGVARAVQVVFMPDIKVRKPLWENEIDLGRRAKKRRRKAKEIHVDDPFAAYQEATRR